jgi:cytochrome b561
MGIYNEKRSFNIRLWHWLSAIAVFGLVFTYILRKTVLDFRANAQIIQVKLSEIGMLIADDKAKEIAKIFRDNMWQWHYYLGFLFIGLLAFRLYAFATKRDKFPSCKAKETTSKEFAAVKYAHAFFM